MSDITTPNSTRDTVILGSGCAGLTAAIYAARANLKPLVLEGHEPGGQLSITTLVENFPGWPEGIQGPDLIENMKQQAVRFGAELKMAHLVSADLSKHPYALNFGHETIHTRTLIIASGASCPLAQPCPANRPSSATASAHVPPATASLPRARRSR
jgi:thioredoxin reductase (NADPH)